jgi:protein SCO1/2
MAGMVVAMWRHKLFVLIFVFSMSACWEPTMPSPFKAVDVTWQHSKADFHLVDIYGKNRSLADFNGKVVVLFFGYTHCPQVCPTTLADLALVLRQLGKDSERVQVLFITLDPERDSPELLARYVPSFNHSFLGLIGDSTAIDQAAKSFGVRYEKIISKDNGYTLDHSNGTFLIGTNGRPILLSKYEQRTEFLVQDIKMLLSMDQK